MREESTRIYAGELVVNAGISCIDIFGGVVMWKRIGLQDQCIQ